MTKEIQYQLDQLLLEQGEYIPLELLLQQGRLSYEDYEAWRNNEIACLDEVLFGDPLQIAEDLQQAVNYMKARGWLASAITYQSWNNERPLSLRFSQHGSLNHCFHQCYHKPQDQPQLDLFTDSPASSLVNGITQALISRNTADARRQLERLYDTAPDHSRLGELECLVVADESLANEINDPAKELDTLQNALQPIAENLLGKNSRNLLIPLWRRLSSAIQNTRFQSSQACLHLSYTAGQSLDWQTVKIAVENESGWESEVILLQRHALATDHLHLQHLSLQSWFMLCWQFPDDASALKNCSNTELRQQWAVFLALDPELPAETFPAMLLTNKPALSELLAGPGSMFHSDDCICPASYSTLFKLLRKRLQTGVGSSNIDDIQLRKKLKQQDPVLFQYFLASVNDNAQHNWLSN